MRAASAVRASLYAATERRAMLVWSLRWLKKFHVYPSDSNAVEMTVGLSSLCGFLNDVLETTEKDIHALDVELLHAKSSEACDNHRLKINIGRGLTGTPEKTALNKAIDDLTTERIIAKENRITI